MAEANLRAEPARANELPFEKRMAEFQICNVRPFYTADTNPGEEVDRHLRQLYALTSAISSGFDGGEISELNSDILVGMMDAINDKVALIAFWAEEARNG